MSDTYRAVIPYESMDPLAIGATDDESKKHRDTLDARDPDRQPRRRDLPRRAGAGRRRDGGCPARRSREPVDGPTFAELLAGKTSVAVVIDNQFRPTPSSKLLPAVFDAIEAAGVSDVRVVCANGKVFPMSESDMEQKLGRDNLARMEANGWAFHQNDPQNPDAYTFVGVSSGGTPVWLHNEVARERGEDHDRPGAGQPLGRGRRRQADPAGRRLGRDDRVEPLRLRHLAADALRRLRRADALGHRRGRDDVRPRLHDERDPRHARPRDRLHLRLAPRGPSRGDPPLQRDLRLRQLGRGAGPGRHRDLRRLRARPTTCSSTRAGAACRPTSC